METFNLEALFLDCQAFWHRPGSFNAYFEILDDRRLVAANGNTLTDLIDEHRIISTNSGSEVWLKIKPESTYSSLSTSLPESPEQTR